MPFTPDRDEMRSPDAAALAQRLRLHQCILRDFGRLALEELEIGPLLQRAAAQAARATGVAHTKILRHRPEQGDLLTEAGVGWKPGVVGRSRLGTDPASPAGRALQTGDAVVIEDVRGHPEYRVEPVLAEHGLVALLNVCISFDGQPWGVFEVDSQRPGHFDALDVEFLETLSCLLAVALYRRETMDRAQQAAVAAARRAERRGLLLAELQHRAKNNLALISAMMSRERRAAARAQEAEGVLRLGRLMQQVNAIGLAQGRLALTEEGGAGEGGATDLAGYLRSLLGSLELSFEGRIRFEVALEPCLLPFDTTVAIGLMVNELVTNAAKHAYPEGESGVVRASLRLDSDRAEGMLTIADEGRGMDPAAVAARRAAGGQGSELVRYLARQIGGEIEQDPVARGASITLRFPCVA
ncbi:GAF domain-containing protein [Roseomonas sp. USHLN139]|uniref:GAF domain-containing protein n=1 Tax=Roseomonas sp. USHLN139 TaxID=3081298 RepID=UPI003B01FF02